MTRAHKTEAVPFIRSADRGVKLEGGLLYVDASGALCVEVSDDYYSGRITDRAALARIGRALMGLDAPAEPSDESVITAALTIELRICACGSTKWLRLHDDSFSCAACGGKTFAR